MNLNKLMKQAQKMQEQMAKTQAELEQKTVEVSAGGGKVKVTANGAGDIIAIKIDRDVVDPNDVEFLEEIVLSAVKQAVEQGKAWMSSAHRSLSAGDSGRYNLICSFLRHSSLVIRHPDLLGAEVGL